MMYLFVVFGILACSFSQLLLKTSANKLHRGIIREFLNPLVIIAYGVFLGSILINIWAMSQGVQLKEMAILESLGYIFVPLLSYFFLKEQIAKRTAIAIIFIITGIIIFYL